MRFFDAKQFTVIPFKMLTKGSQSEAVDAVVQVWSNLGLNHATRPRSIHLAKGMHKSLEEDIGKKLSTELQDVMEEEASAKHLAYRLAKMGGITLFGYEGKVDSSQDIAGWLEKNW